MFYYRSTPSISAALFYCFNIFGLILLVGYSKAQMDFSRTNMSHSQNDFRKLNSHDEEVEDFGSFIIESEDLPVTNWHDLDNNYPPFLQAYATYEGRQYRLQLIQNAELLTERYEETEKNGHISKYKNFKNLKNFCYYHGSIVGSPNSYAAVNICKGQISGTFHVDNVRFFVESTNSTNAKVFKNFDNDKHQQNLSCGFVNNNSTSTNRELPKFSRKRRAVDLPNYYSRYIKWNQLYVEFAIVFDDSMYRKYNRDVTLLYDRAKRLVNLMNAFYQPVNIKIALVAVEIWQHGDPFTVNNSGDSTLDSFHMYRSSRMTGDKANDNAQLITEIAFNGGVVGKALKGTICSSDMSDAVVNDHSAKEIYVAATMAHEMGHNFGMEHDNETCDCPMERCIMAASSGSTAPLYWSTCSLEYLSWALTHGSDVCLKNKPTRFFGGPFCGNGFTEPGEECDCGLPSVCDNKCCNATTCKFNDGASCASGQCCDVNSCTVKPLATECRAATNDCDLPEYCNGKSEFCPADTHKHDGIACNNNKAYCSDGQCTTHDDQCSLIWGPTGKSAEQMCYNLNSKGDPSGNCGMQSKAYIPCPQTDVQCGRLQCNHQNERTAFGSKSVVRFINTILRTSAGDETVCQSARIDLGSDTRDPGLVPNGAKCGGSGALSKKMCLDTKCVDVNSVLEKNNCKNNCHDVGICNNLGNCHCESGYGGVDCGIPGLGGSIDSGPASVGGQFNMVLAILLFVFVVIPIIIIIITFLYRKRLMKSPRLKILRAFFPSAGPDHAKRAAGTAKNSANSNGTTAKHSNVPPSSQQPKFSPIVPQLPATAATKATLWSTNNHNQNNSYSKTPAARTTEVTWHQNRQPAVISSLDALSSTNNSLNVDASTTLTRKHSTSRPSVPAPPRPRRPDGETMEKLYAEAPELAPSKPGSDSLLTDVLTALKIDDDDKIVPHRRAPPPPATTDYSEPSKYMDVANGSSSGAVTERKKLFEVDVPSSSAACHSLGRNAGGKAAIATAVISKPLNPLIGGTPADQAPSLTVVGTLPRTVAKIHGAKPLVDTAVDSKPHALATTTTTNKNGAANRAALRRSSSGSSGSSGPRPVHAPPLPPKPSNLSLNNNSESENYYDIIPSPVNNPVKQLQQQQQQQQMDEDLYADIDEYRKIDDNKLFKNDGTTINKVESSKTSVKPGPVAPASKVSRLAAGFEAANRERSKSPKN